MQKFWRNSEQIVESCRNVDKVWKVRTSLGNDLYVAGCWDVETRHNFFRLFKYFRLAASQIYILALALTEAGADQRRCDSKKSTCDIMCSIKLNFLRFAMIFAHSPERLRRNQISSCIFDRELQFNLLRFFTWFFHDFYIFLYFCIVCRKKFRIFP